ncbi:putative integral membrane protein [Actinacidiphila cocklensis]|uniref:Integral membrane protein n=1 Tax=Actinacidiphila cocklensis TaxID=887465 RepID=A0A9W4DSQ4_9ACTN|nr:putative integral membrane protein [Actinacidiphila cocklensis]
MGGVQHDGFKYRVRAAGLLLTAAYLAFAAWLLLRPHYVAWVPSPNLRPFGTIRADLRMGTGQAARHLLAGLGLLAPLGILLPMAGGRIETSGVASFVRTVFAGLMVSISFEFTQTMVPGQLFDVDALILNTAGVALAHLLVVPATRRHLRRRELLPQQEGAPQGRGELREQRPAPL